MRPVLLDLGGDITFPAYFTLLTIGFALAMVYTVRESRRLGMDHQRILDTNLWMVFWGIVGSRLLHIVADTHFHDYVNLCVNPKLVAAVDAKVAYCNLNVQCGYDYLCDALTHKCFPPRDCLAVFKIWRGGFAYYGGFIAAVAFAIYYVRKHNLGWWRTADLASPGIALGLVFGRIGCFLNGCCYGKETTSAWGVVFPRGGSAWRAQLDAGHIPRLGDALPVHPTQLYESAACLVIFMILWWLERKKQPGSTRHGHVFAGLLVLYGVARFVIEYFRDDDRGVFFSSHLSTSQLISLPLFAGGLALLWRMRNRDTP